MMSLRTHNIFDYVGGVLLLAAPWIFNFAMTDLARNCFVGAGAFLILYSLFTNYPYSLSRQIPIGVHMILDLMTGAFLIVAPWLFTYREALTPGQEYLHYVLGIGLFGIVAVTRVHTEADKQEETKIYKNRGPATAGRV